MSIKGSKVVVQDDNVDKALRKLKKKVNDSGVLQTLQQREHYIKPSVRRKLAKSQAKKRWLRQLLSQQLPTKNY